VAYYSEAREVSRVECTGNVEVLDGERTARGERADFDAVNGLLDRVQGPMLDAASDRLDPSIKTFAVPALNFTSTDLADLLGTWRAEAWGNARDLLQATTPHTKAAVHARIERNAETRARVLEAATSYALTGLRSEDRDAFCSTAGG
jgi:hypothetical protein